jgi:predicted dehydrogenase
MNRRAFMKQTAAAGLSVLPVSTLFGEATPSKTVRIAMMGCHPKGRGWAVMRALMKLKGVEIATVCDVDARARAAAADQVLKTQGKKPKQEVDIRKVLEDKTIDGIATVTPDHWHAPAALMAMKAGKAIYVEKPVSYNPQEGEILVEAAKLYKVPFQMGNQRRSSVAFQAALAEIRKGIIGEPRYARCWYTTQRQPMGKGKVTAPPEWLDWNLWQGPAPRREYKDNIVHYKWHWLRHYGTGECGNNAPHFIDVARLALGALFPRRTTSGGGRLFHKGDDWEWYDTQTVSVEFENNTFMTWEGLTSVRGRPYEGVGTGAMIYGLKGSLLFSSNDTCTLFDPSGKELRKWGSKIAGDGAVDRTNPTNDLDVTHTGNWIDCIRANSTETISPALDAHATTLIAHLGNIALSTGETVWTDPKTGKLTGKVGQEFWSREYEKGWEMKI